VQFKDHACLQEKHNVLAMSGKAVEASGDVNTLASGYWGSY
jgi:high-affinity K+ transport system ATPase subunit B